MPERNAIPGELYPLGAATLIVLREAAKCARCGCAHLLFLNRQGRTFCLACAEEKYAERTECTKCTN